jgi:antitoxin HicB
MTTTTKNKDVAYYLGLPYAVEITAIAERDGGGYNACVPLLGRWSAVGDGATIEEAARNLYDALPSLLQDWLDRGVTIPEPVDGVATEASEYKGKLLLRMPKSLHAKAARIAEREGVSLNMFMTAAIAEAVGAKLGALARR